MAKKPKHKTQKQGFPEGSVVENPPPMQEMQAQSLIWEYPTCCKAAVPLCHLWASALDSGAKTTEAWVPWTHALQPERPLQPCTSQLESSRCLQQLEKSPDNSEDPAWPKINEITNIYENWKPLSCVRLFVSPWTIQSMKFPRPESWSG